MTTFTSPVIVGAPGNLGPPVHTLGSGRVGTGSQRWVSVETLFRSGTGYRGASVGSDPQQAHQVFTRPAIQGA